MSLDYAKNAEYSHTVSKVKYTQDKQYRLSVLLVTYNHEKYIRQALNTLFGQIIEEAVELVIADDGSSDSTLDIIREYEGKDSRFFFKYIESMSNLGITRNYQRGFAACTGKYVAVLEGDDYWINPMKLQFQRNFLDQHWECELCSVNYFIYEENSCLFYSRLPVGTGHILLGARELIADNIVGNFSTCMYRRKALDKLPPNIFDILSYDWVINICIGQNGLIAFLQEPMSVYRIHKSGAWNKIPHIEKLKAQLELIPTYDELTGLVFHQEFSSKADELNRVIKDSHVKDILKPAITPLIKSPNTIIDFLPPIFLSMIRLLLPPVLKRYLVEIIRRGRA